MNVLDIIFLVIVCTGIIGGVAYGIWYKLTHAPAKWKMDGPVPSNTQAALDVIYDMLPTKPKRWGGIIHWTWVPIEFSDADGKHSAAGLVINGTTPEIKVQWFKNVWESALAHELIHVSTGWEDGDSRLQPLVEKINAAIKQKLAAVV